MNIVAFRVFLIIALAGMALSGLISFLFDASFGVGSFWGFSILSILIGMNVKHFLIIPEGNMAIILQNELIASSGDMVEGKYGIKIPNGQRVVFTGFNLKYPWEAILGDPISLVKTVPLSGTVEALAGNDKKLFVEWTAAMTPIPDENLMLYRRTDESAAIVLFKSLIEITIQTETRKHKADYIYGKSKGYYTDCLKTIFGEGNVAVNSEREFARNVTNVTVNSVKLEESSQNVLEDLANADHIAAITKKVLASAGNNPLVQQAVVAAALRTQLAGNVLQLVDGKPNGKGKSGK